MERKNNGRVDCIICKQPILNRSLKGKAVTCCQKCAGVLAWETRLG